LEYGPYWTDVDLWRRVWIAIQRIVAATLLLGIHFGFHWTVRTLFGNEMARVADLLNVVESVLIVALNTALLLEAVRIFLPGRLGLRIDSERNEAALRNEQ
jgi:hypothetical protein